jgi:hypothetical protein
MRKFRIKSSEATEERGEKATVVEKPRVRMKSASSMSLVNGRSQLRAASHVSSRRRRDAARKQASSRIESVECN